MFFYFVQQSPFFRTLNELELGEFSYSERSKIATQLVKNRQERRYHKDVVEEPEPIINFFDNPQNRNFMNQLTQLLGKVRKIESYHQNRVYVPKVIPGETLRKDNMPYVMSEDL